jgi:hypothetical protein
MRTFTHQELLEVSEIPCECSSRLTLNLALVNVLRDSLWTTTINLAADGEGSAENLLHRTLELAGHGLVPHGARNLDDVVKRNGLGVLDVLLLLAVSRWLLEGLDDERAGGWNDGDGGLTVLDGQADCDTETFLYDILVST